jgi:non-specific serine/threonine protein kinase/serine/threonine-protein kinase
MDAERYSRLKQAFQALLEVGRAERAAAVERLAGADAELAAELARWLASEERDAGGWLETPAEGDPELAGSVGRTTPAEGGGAIPERIGPWRLEAEIGRGGMGSVYRARRDDGAFEQTVAIKLVRAELASELLLRRFLGERRILAGLVHPNIAHLIDGGTTAEGVPYLVLEHVAGEPIDHFCDRRSLPVEERLRLFLVVCGAVHFAHQKLVLHRDIKSANVLVDHSGQPKLLDFGIAKLIAPGPGEEDLTALGWGRPLTLEWASPEQLRGDALTTAADVYSLGVLLHVLLAGKRPHRWSGQAPAAFAREIEESGGGRLTGWTSSNQAAPPGVLGKSLRGDLQRIVEQALAPELERRYGTVAELTADLERYLAGRPVSAHPPSARYRLGKFLRRHRAAAAAAALVALALVAGAVSTLWQAHVARQQRDKAEQRFGQVRKLANSLVFELHDSIENLPGSTPSRELLVRRALEYLDSLAEEADPSLHLELAAAYDRIGDIQGGFGTSHLGQRDKAGQSYRKALAIREALAAAAPENSEFQRQLSISYAKLGDILWIGTDMSGALEAYGKALALNQRIAAAAPDDARARSDLALAHGKFGYLLGANDRTAEALENTRKAVALMEELVAADPDSTKLQSDLARAYDQVAEILTALTDNYAEALVLMRKAQTIGEKLAAADPLNTKLRRGQAVGDFNVALVSAKLGDVKTSLDSSRRALSRFTEMLAADPQNDEFRQGSALVQTFLGEMTIKDGRAVEGIALLRQPLQLLEQSFAASPTDEIAHFRLANVQQALGQGYLALAADAHNAAPTRLAHWREARSWLARSREIYQGFRDAGRLTGEDAVRLDTVIDQIAQCDAAIARLGSVARGRATGGPSK